MAYFHTTVVDNQIKALPTVDTASGSIATFDTDLTENLVEVKCQIVATQSGSGTPSPSNPRPITVYTSLNLSHSGSDTSNPNVTNIPFGQNVANGVLDITTGKLRVTHGYDMLKTSETWNYSAGWSKTNTNVFYSDTQHPEIKFPDLEYQSFLACNYLPVGSRTDLYVGDSNMLALSGGTTRGQLTVRIDKTICPDLTSFIQWITDNQVYYVYELTSPLTVQLDSITLQALLNENNIWCDTNGDTEVKYLLTIGKKIS